MFPKFKLLLFLLVSYALASTAEPILSSTSVSPYDAALYSDRKKSEQSDSWVCFIWNCHSGSSTRGPNDICLVSPGDGFSWTWSRRPVLAWFGGGDQIKRVGIRKGNEPTLMWEKPMSDVQLIFVQDRLGEVTYSMHYIEYDGPELEVETDYRFGVYSNDIDSSRSDAHDVKIVPSIKFSVLLEDAWGQISLPSALQLFSMPHPMQQQRIEYLSRFSYRDGYMREIEEETLQGNFLMDLVQEIIYLDNVDEKNQLIQELYSFCYQE